MLWKKSVISTLPAIAINRKIIKNQQNVRNHIDSVKKPMKKYYYDIYYYGINDMVTMEEIVEQAEKDSKAGIVGSDMYKEGGTMEYYYDTYTIIKSHSLDGNKDVYIGVSEMRLNMVR